MDIDMDIDDASPEIQAVTNIPLPNHRLELLGLPPELRLMIYRHLLVYPWGFEIEGRLLGRPPPVQILRTSRLIYSEAFVVLYRENEFVNNYFDSWSRPSYLSRFTRLVDTMQNIHIDIATRRATLHLGSFLQNMNHFTGPTTIRGTLTVCWIHNDRVHRNLLDLFIMYLCRATNFRTIHFHISRDGEFDRVYGVLQYFEAALVPTFGPADCPIREGNGLRFHPVRHLNRLRQLTDGN
ncbi:hypothetical protein MMC07_003360 [Pseudocyphellaria aurata]|nr:hypothetical protein [Pseudocyphellaria aurata]